MEMREQKQPWLHDTNKTLDIVTENDKIQTDKLIDFKSTNTDILTLNIANMILGKTETIGPNYFRNLKKDTMKEIKTNNKLKNIPVYKTRKLAKNTFKYYKKYISELSQKEKESDIENIGKNIYETVEQEVNSENIGNNLNETKKLHFSCKKKIEHKMRNNFDKIYVSNNTKLKILKEINFETLPNKINQMFNMELTVNKLLLKIATIDFWKMVVKDEVAFRSW